MSDLRKFDTGATRGTEQGKLDYEGFLSPLVLQRYAQYLHKHRIQTDNALRDSDNWQKGIPKNVYIKSLFRHFVDLWLHHRQFPSKTVGNIEDALCGVLFNAFGYLYELLKEAEK